MQERYGLSVQHFGLEFGAGSFFLIAGTQLTPRLAARWTSAQVLGATLIVGTAAAGAMVVTAATGFGGLVGLLGATQFGVAGLVGPVFGVLGVSAVTMAAVITGALALSLTVYLLVVQPWRLDPMDHETVPVARAPTHREPWPNSTHPTGR
jgi:DHA1 family bicyclomycin/chloramphenicol resistance-like MFS transporter